MTIYATLGQMSLFKNQHRKGFTLIEILIVIGIIGILASIVIVAINPNKQLDDARGAGRTQSRTQLENAMVQYLIDQYELPGDAGIPAGAGAAVDICRTGITDVSCINMDDLVPEFLVSIPVDPEETDANLSGYSVYLDGAGRVQVVANYAT